MTASSGPAVDVADVADASTRTIGALGVCTRACRGRSAAGNTLSDVPTITTACARAHAARAALTAASGSASPKKTHAGFAGATPHPPHVGNAPGTRVVVRFFLFERELPTTPFPSLDSKQTSSLRRFLLPSVCRSPSSSSSAPVRAFSRTVTRVAGGSHKRKNVSASSDQPHRSRHATRRVEPCSSIVRVDVL
jgi:hypothetical protein